MKYIIILAVLASSSISFASELTIKLTNLKSTKGKVLIALYDSSKGFPKDYNMAIEQAVVKTTRNFSYTFKNLPSGNYAVALFHDKNANEKMDTNFIGIPKEGFGFSNNPKVFTGPPGFNKAKFILKSNTRLTKTIKLIHFL
jgi:uncharacterized protein (DUF2141 family)